MSKIEKEIEKDIKNLEKDFSEKQEKVKEFSTLENNIEGYMKQAPDIEEEKKKLKENKEFNDKYKAMAEQMEKDTEKIEFYITNDPYELK